MKIADLMVAASEACADIWYLSGFKAPDDFIYYSCDGHADIVLSPLEFDRAKAQAPERVRVHDFREFVSDTSRLPALLNAIGRREGVTCWRVPASFPVKIADGLRRDGFQIKVCEGAFAPQRAVKTQAEIDAVRAANDTAQAAMRRAWEILAESGRDAGGRLIHRGALLTSEILRRAIEVECASRGATASGTIAAGGVQGAQPHNTGSGVLMADTPIVIDIFPRDNDTGYWGDLTRTVVRGRAPEIVKKAFDAVKSARDAAIAGIAPGVSGKLLHEKAAAMLAGAGFPTGKDAMGRTVGFFHGLGHGVGMEIHEAPRLSPGSDRPLEAGNVVTVEPGVYHPEWGGMRLEDLIVVTGDGARDLTDIETVLEIPF